MDVGSRPGDAPSPVGAGQPTGTPTSDGATTSRPTVNVALSLLGFLVALLVAWAIANPFGGFPDELDHYVRSVSISQGQWVGQPGPLAPPPAVRSCCGPSATASYWVTQGNRIVTIESALTPENLSCDEVLATPRIRDCGSTAGGIIGAQRITTMGTIEPAGYLAPALAIAIGASSPDWAFRLARLGDVLVAALVLGLTLMAVARSQSSLLRFAGISLAITPMAAFVMSSGSPNATEVAGAIGVWCTALIVTAPGERPSRWAWAGMAGSIALLVLSRSLGPVWILSIAAVVLVLRGRQGLVRTVRGRRRQWLVIVAVAVSAAMVTIGWEQLVQPKVDLDVGFGLSQLPEAISDIPGIAQETIGNFGPLQIPLPIAMTAAWAVLLIGAVIAAWVVGTWRERLALIVTCGLILAFTILIAAFVLRQNGFGLQGRHVLPMVVGVPILAAEVLVMRRPQMSRAALPLAAAVVVLQILAWVVGVGSYRAGAGGLVPQRSVDILGVTAAWPVAMLALLATGVWFVVAVATASRRAELSPDTAP